MSRTASASTGVSLTSPTNSIRKRTDFRRSAGSIVSASNIRRAMSNARVPEDVLFCWSGGKDSAMAVHALLAAGNCRITALLTTITEKYDRISMHGVRRTLLERQAESIGLPLHPILIPPQCVNATYEERMNDALAEHFARGVRRVAVGDIFLEDLRIYRERNLAQAGMAAHF